MTPCYIAGPYAAPTAEERERNVARAVLLGRLACELGYAPLVPHAIGTLGVLGSPAEDDGCRERAIRCGEALARTVGLALGRAWIILRGDYTLSPGTERELVAFGLGHQIKDCELDDLLPIRGPSAVQSASTHRALAFHWDGWCQYAEMEAVRDDVRAQLEPLLPRFEVLR